MTNSNVTVLSVVIVVVAAAALLVARKVFAKLKPGSPAPPFHAQAALGDAIVEFDLQTALANGPVVLFFFPRAFTTGCTAEAHLFSQHIDDFRALGASVLGISGDTIETQRRFSMQACRSAFAIAADPGLRIAKLYDAALVGELANRTTYVIGKDGKIASSYASLFAEQHVIRSLAALRKLPQRP